jgi:hypothetical protein
MPQRMAGALALVVFAACLVIGGVQTGNPLSTVVQRALVAMAGTFAVGLVAGAMAQKMLDENVASAEQKLSGEKQTSEAATGKEAGAAKK